MADKRISQLPVTIAPLLDGDDFLIRRGSGDHVNVSNSLRYSYVFGDADTDGSYNRMILILGAIAWPSS